LKVVVLLQQSENKFPTQRNEKFKEWNKNKNNLRFRRKNSSQLTRLTIKVGSSFDHEELFVSAQQKKTHDKI